MSTSTEAPPKSLAAPCGGPQHFASLSDLPAEAVERLEECAFAYGESFDSYLVTEPNREYFFSSGMRGVVGFRRWGKNIQVVGGLLASADDQETLLTELIEFARGKRWRLTIFGVSRADFKVYRQHGFQITKWGEEPIVLLDETEWKGKSYEWLRRQESVCRKGGVTFREIDPHTDPTDYESRLAPILDEISNEHLAGTLHQGAMKFFVSQFEPLSLRRRRLFVAETASRIECFIVLNPCLAGKMWAIESIRKRTDAVRGVVPFAMLQAMRELQTEKVRYVSLSLIPCLRTGEPLAGDSFVMRGSNYFLWHYGSSLYDVRGMYHFRSRFRPHWREMYIASLPGMSWSSIFTIIILWGLLNVNPLRFIRQWWQDRSDPSRKSLAQPPWRAERIIKHLSIDEPVLQPTSTPVEQPTLGAKVAICDSEIGVG